MGRKGNWFSSVKKTLSPEPKEPKDPKSSKPKKKWFGKQKQIALDSNHTDTAAIEPSPHLHPQPEEEVKVLVDEHNEETKQVYHVTTMTNVASPVDVPEVVPVSFVTQFVGKSTEEVAAIKIQKSFRGYQARRALRALRGLVRLKSLIEGPTVKRQVANTMRYTQMLARLQSQIHSRRLRMSEENQALQRQLLHERAKELDDLKIGEDWDLSLQSKEQTEANLLKKFEAAMRRERALAYSFTHQQTWKNQPKSTSSMFLDPTNPAWGWSRLERWMAAPPWEKDSSGNDTSSTKNSTINNIAGEISKSYAKYQLNSGNGFHSATPSKQGSASATASRKLKPPGSPKSSLGGGEDESRSMASAQSEMTRRYSVGAASVRDDESLGCSASAPSYMVATHSAKAKSRFQSPAGPEKNGIMEKVSYPGAAKKRLSFPSPSPAKPRRYSAPPKVNNGSIQSMTNGVAAA